MQQQIPEGVTQWAPVGARTVGGYDYEIIPQPNAFHTMHVGPNNTDNVWIVTAPRLVSLESTSNEAGIARES